jgi:hypothetical protein
VVLGPSWSAPVVISDVTSGAAYKHADGFDEVYGDYGEIAITSEGKTIATWGEGLSWTGPGGGVVQPPELSSPKGASDPGHGRVHHGREERKRRRAIARKCGCPPSMPSGIVPGVRRGR